MQFAVVVQHRGVDEEKYSVLGTRQFSASCVFHPEKQPVTPVFVSCAWISICNQHLPVCFTLLAAMQLRRDPCAMDAVPGLWYSPPKVGDTVARGPRWPLGNMTDGGSGGLGTVVQLMQSDMTVSSGRERKGKRSFSPLLLHQKYSQDKCSSCMYLMYENERTAKSLPLVPRGPQSVLFILFLC